MMSFHSLFRECFLVVRASAEAQAGRFKVNVAATCGFFRRMQRASDGV